MFTVRLMGKWHTGIHYVILATFLQLEIILNYLKC